MYVVRLPQLPSGVSHLPVLLSEVVDLLAPRPGEVLVDCTAGLGGHAEAIGRLVGATGDVVLNDLDPSNLERASRRVRGLEGDQAPASSDLPAQPIRAADTAGSAPHVRTIAGNFAELPRMLEAMGIGADMALADLGFSSNQVDTGSRGLSFSQEGPLDMRLDPSTSLTAADLVGSLSERELAQIIAEFGEDPAGGRIARKLVQARRSKPITTTLQLAELVRAAAGYSTPSRTDPATRTFQALRIAVNDELGNLDALLAGVRDAAAKVRRGVGSWLRAGARVAVISFHSLEDRRVKASFKALADEGLAVLLTDGPVTAGEEELGRNPRSRSAKLRAIKIFGDATV